MTCACTSGYDGVQVTLQVANGDREKAVKMLEDPDALMANPEVQRIIGQGASRDIEVVPGVYPEGGDGEAKGMGSTGVGTKPSDDSNGASSGRCSGVRVSSIS